MPYVRFDTLELASVHVKEYSCLGWSVRGDTWNSIGRKEFDFDETHYKGNVTYVTLRHFELRKQKKTHKKAAQTSEATESKIVKCFLCWLCIETVWTIDDTYSKIIWEED